MSRCQYLALFFSPPQFIFSKDSNLGEQCFLARFFTFRGSTRNSLNIGYEQFQSKNKKDLGSQLIFGELLLCGWVDGVGSGTRLNGGKRQTDSARDTVVCPFISGVHGRAQQWQLIHQPQEYHWASWNRTKNHLYPSSSSPLILSRICLSRRYAFLFIHFCCCCCCWFSAFACVTASTAGVAKARPSCFAFIEVQKKL